METEQEIPEPKLDQEGVEDIQEQRDLHICSENGSGSDVFPDLLHSVLSSAQFLYFIVQILPCLFGQITIELNS